METEFQFQFEMIKNHLLHLTMMEDEGYKKLSAEDKQKVEKIIDHSTSPEKCLEALLIYGTSIEICTTYVRITKTLTERLESL